MPTPTAAAGRYQSKSGEDLVHYLDEKGAVVYWASSDGVMSCKDCVIEGGISISTLQQQVQSIINTGLPAVVDCGNF